MSQERFWQARLLSREAEHRKELSAIHQQLEALKDTTSQAKAELETLNVVDTLTVTLVLFIHIESSRTRGDSSGVRLAFAEGVNFCDIWRVKDYFTG